MFLQQFNQVNNAIIEAASALVEREASSDCIISNKNSRNIVGNGHQRSVYLPDNAAWNFGHPHKMTQSIYFVFTHDQQKNWPWRTACREVTAKQEHNGPH